MARQLAPPPTDPSARPRMSYDDWLAWPEAQTRPTEWVDGEVIVFEMPSERHQDLVGLLFILVSWYARKFDLGKAIIAPFEMRILGGSRSREPDVVFVAAAHAERRTGKRLDGPADLVVEVVSDDSVVRDGREKLAEYAAAGVPEYWLVDPRPGREAARFFQLAADGNYREAGLDAAGRYHSRVLPGFWLDPAWLRQDPLPDPDDLKPMIAASRTSA